MTGPRIDTDAAPWGGCSLRLLPVLVAVLAIVGTRVTRKRRRR